jgi:hypothetical protein
LTSPVAFLVAGVVDFAIYAVGSLRRVRRARARASAPGRNGA